MLDFRSGSTKVATAYGTQSPSAKQTVDHGRLLMMAISSVLLLGMIFTLGKPGSRPAGATGYSVETAESAASETPPNSRMTLMGVAILTAALCVVATAMFVLYRMAGAKRSRFTVHDLAEPAPDFRALEALPPAPTPRDELAHLTVADETPAEPLPPVITAPLA